MEYKKIKEINEYKSESINPMKTPDTMYELYSVPFFTTGHPEYLHGSEIGSSKVTVQKNDILVCKINPRINRVWVVADESNYQSIASSEWIVVRTAQHNPYFLAWYFRTPMFQQLMTSEVTGIGGSLTRAQPKRVVEYPVPVLSREKQDKIVSILDRLESIKRERKSELDLLDSLVKARFVEMFGDPSLPNRNYPIIQLEDIADVKSSHRIFTSDFVEEGIPFYRGKEIGELARGEVPKEVYYISTEKYKEISNDDSKPLIGDLLMPSICDKGQVWMVNTESPFYYKDGRVLCISPDRNRINPQYFQHYIKMRTISEYPKLGSGSTFAEFKIFQLKRLMISLPPLDRQNQFAEIVTRINKSKVAIDHGVILIRKALQSGYHNVWGN